MRRGWMEEELVLSLGGRARRRRRHRSAASTSCSRAFETAACPAAGASFAGAPLLKRAARLALRAHVAPSIDTEVHKALREVADAAAIAVFAENVRKLLLAAPFGPKAVLGVDPGLRTGCKLAVVDDTGRYIGSGLMHLETPAGKAAAAPMLADLVKKGGIRAVAVGNGTAGRETETFVREALRHFDIDVPVVMVSEAGASVYSASDVAREEFPDLDVTVRGAISIARRLQDPLAELVKIDPKSIGVGQYQHDVSQTGSQEEPRRRGRLVRQPGRRQREHRLVPPARRACPGSGPGWRAPSSSTAPRRGCSSRATALLEVPRFSKKVFEQAAGFLRVPDAADPLDNTGVHPERYAALERAGGGAGRRRPRDAARGGREAGQAVARRSSRELGAFTFDDIVRELEKPGRDPRESFVPFSFRADIHELKDLQPGMVCPGIVTNVTNFGAFVDIGVHQDGLVHISQLADKFVKDPQRGGQRRAIA